SDPPEQQVVEFDDLSRHPKPDRSRRSSRRESITAFAQFLARTAAVINEPSVLQYGQCAFIKRNAMRLVNDFAIPLQSVSPQCLQNPFPGTRHNARRGEVFHAHQPPPTRAPRENPRA